MEVIDMARTPNPPEPVDAPATPHEQCGQCGSAVDQQQRYCVVCGTRRQHVTDPAIRYLSQASAGARKAGTARSGAPVRRSVGLGTALIIALLPLAVVLGVLVGRASTSGDAKLISELRSQRPEVVTAGAGGSTAAATVSGSHATHTGGTRTRTHGHKASHSSTSTAGNSTSNGSGGAAPLTGKATQAQLNQGAAAAQKVQHSTGKSYVNSQQGLPNVVVVP